MDGDAKGQAAEVAEEAGKNASPTGLKLAQGTSSVGDLKPNCCPWSMKWKTKETQSANRQDRVEGGENGAARQNADAEKR